MLVVDDSHFHFFRLALILRWLLWQTQSNPVACECEYVASVTNDDETLKLPWCDASGDGVSMADLLLAEMEQPTQAVSRESRIDVLCLLVNNIRG
jgi:hypothetical protein